MAKKMMLEEKRTKMLEVFDKYKTFFKIQELEKIGSKEKGIVENTVKDVVLGLFYDDLICSEKVGTSVYYWSNFNKKMLEDIKSIKKFEDENNEIQNKIKNAIDMLEIEKDSKQITDRRMNKIKELDDLTKMYEDMKNKLDEYSEMSKEEFDKMKEEEGALINSINKMTDNIFIIQDYVSNKFNMDKKEVNKTFNIDDEMDYIA
ncbi:hypothetical protein P3W45_000816 [Vairimorpha bombi]|jgi:hypothetical protein